MADCCARQPLPTLEISETGSYGVAPEAVSSLDKLSESIQPKLLAMKVSQDMLEQQLKDWMNTQAGVLSEVKSQQQKLHSMFTEVTGCLSKVCCSANIPPSIRSTPKSEPLGETAFKASAMDLKQDLQQSSHTGLKGVDCIPELKVLSSPDGRTPARRFESLNTTMERVARMREIMKKQVKPSVTLSELAQEEGFTVQTAALRCVTNSAFEQFFGFLIIANAALIGAEVEYRTTEDKSSSFFVAAQYFFCVMFVGEFIVRLIAAGWKRHFFGRQWRWSWFDAVMATLSIIEVIDSITATEGGDDVGSQMLRIIRIARLARTVRVLRFSPQLKLMVFMCYESAKSLVYALILIAILLYVFAICFTMGASEYLKKGDGTQRSAKDIHEYFGTVFRSVYTLYKGVTNGQSWGENLDPLFDMGSFYSIIFVFWISFAVLALLNIVTGFVVDGALAKSAQERDLMAERELERKRATVQTLKDIFNESDTDNTGTVGLDEFIEHMHDERVAAYLSALKIDTSHLKELFQEIDVDGSGTLDINEFVDNMQHVMGANSTDQNVQRLLLENRIATERFDRFVKDVIDNLHEMHALMIAMPAKLKDDSIDLRQKDPSFGLVGDVLDERCSTGVSLDWEYPI